MSECVKVVVRCRPLNSREKSLGCVNVISMDKKKKLGCNQKIKSHKFIRRLA